MFAPDDSAALLGDDTAARLAAFGTNPQGCGGTMFLRDFVADHGDAATIADALAAFEAIPGRAKIAWALSMLAVQGERLYPGLRLRLAAIVAQDPTTAAAALRALDGVGDDVKALLRQAALDAGVVIAEGRLPIKDTIRQG